MRFAFLVSIVALIVPCYGADGDWFDAPDGFKWPATATRQLQDEKQFPFRDLPDVIQKFVTKQSSPSKEPSHVETARADLDGDGELEWFVEIPALGGTGGRFYEIMTITKKKRLRSLGGVQGGFSLVVPEKGSSWLRIEGSSRGGGGHLTRYLLAFRDHEYREVRNEDHDYNAGKATVRK